jgi:hypothetical protein
VGGIVDRRHWGRPAWERSAANFHSAVRQNTNDGYGDCSHLQFLSLLRPKKAQRDDAANIPPLLDTAALGEATMPKIDSAP